MTRTGLFFTIFSSALVSGCVMHPDEEIATAGSTTAATASSTGTAAETDSGSSPQTGSTDSDGDAPTTGGDEELFNCDPWSQDCPEGLKCMAYTDDGDYFTGTRCTPVVPNGGVAGDECHADGGWSTGVDDCAKGFACWNINPETSIGGCVALCTGTMDDYDCPDAEDICVFWTPGFAHVCLETCDPFLQDCPQGQLCAPDWTTGGQEFVCILDWSFDEGQEFDPCFSANGCDPGLICLDPSVAVECDQEAYCCLSYCDLENPTCTGKDSVCEPFYEEGTAPPEYANLGICGLPG